MFIRGGEQITAVTLTRFYALHVFVLPALVVVFLAVHFFMVRRQGIAGPYYEETDDDKPVWP